MIKINDWELSSKAMATLEARVRDSDKIRQLLQKWQNNSRSSLAKVSKYQNEENIPMPKSQIKLLLAECDLLWGEFMELAMGNHEAYRNNKKFAGILPHGKQLSLFEPKFEASGTEPAATQKGGIADAK